MPARNPEQAVAARAVAAVAHKVRRHLRDQIAWTGNPVNVHGYWGPPALGEPRDLVAEVNHDSAPFAWELEDALNDLLDREYGGRFYVAPESDYVLTVHDSDRSLWEPKEDPR